MEPIPVWTELRGYVLERNQRRCPHWYFRLASDLVLDLQPRPGTRRDCGYAFRGEAAQGDGITRERMRLRDNGLPTVSFGIKAATTPWTLTFCGAGAPVPRLEGEEWSAYRARHEATSNTRGAALMALRARVIAELVPARFASLRPEMLLAPACLICGKVLTDPISMARWIGPECYHNFRWSPLVRVPAAESPAA